MKKLFLISIFALLGIIQSYSQEYVPFVREGVRWVCFYYNEDNDPQYLDQYFQPGKTYFTLELKGDTTIDGHDYKALHKYGGECINTENDTILIYLREEDRIVYGIVPDGKTYPDFRIGYGPLLLSPIYQMVNSGKEFIMYDFNDPASYYQSVCENYPGERHFEYLGTEKLSINGKKPLSHHFKIMNRYEFYFIEGIGFDGYHPGYPLDYLTVGVTDEPNYFLSHVIEDGKTIYHGINHDYIAPWDGRLPIVRDGVKWVNERVIINHGDTTRYYYTYEVNGLDSRDARFSLCHYYIGKDIDMGNDSIICTLRETPGWNEVLAAENHAMDKVIQEDRNMMQRWVWIQPYIESIYVFRLYDDPTYPIYEYIRRQQMPAFLNYNNLILVDPVEVDGYECARYAYLDEDGNPQAYIVEGIGFDSRDMGDLLTPFTRKPDPDADYQEYCGLSHVIKDGKIIYKGMRFDPERVYGVPGDMNGDGEIGIDDLALLIDWLLTDAPRYTYTGDFSGDGAVDIADVSSLIDYLLTR